MCHLCITDVISCNPVIKVILNKLCAGHKPVHTWFLLCRKLCVCVCVCTYLSVCVCARPRYY